MSIFLAVNWNHSHNTVTLNECVQSGAPNDCFLWNICSEKQNCLEFSIAWGRQKISWQSFHSCTQFSKNWRGWINETCLKPKIKASAWKTIRKTQYSCYENYFQVFRGFSKKSYPENFWSLSKKFSTIFWSFIFPISLPRLGYFS